MTAPGTRYRNTSGRTLYGFFPPDAEVEVRDDGLDELVTLEYKPDDGTGVGNAVVVPPADLSAHFEKIGDPQPQDTEESETDFLRRQVAELQRKLDEQGGADNG